MPINSTVNVPNYQTLEYQKFVQIYNDSRFPPVTAVYSDYYSGTQTQIYDKYAILTYDIGQNAALGPINTLPFGDNASIDAFGRLRISIPDTIINIKQTVDNAPLLFTQGTVGTGNVYYDSDNASSMLTVSANNDVAIRQTKQYFNYQPGKSQLLLTTFCMQEVENTISRVGYFDSSTTSPYNTSLEGFYLQNNNGVISVHIANTGGQPSQSAIQNEWNIDKMDGTGQSGITLDLTKTQILAIDFEWLGVGRVRFGFVINGLVFYVHQFVHANNISLPYLKNPNKPLRWEIRSSGGIAALRQICGSVISEGGAQTNGEPRGVNTGSASIGNITDGVTCPLITLRLKENYKSFTISLKDFGAMAFSTTNSILTIISNGVISNSAAFVDVTNSAVQYSLGAANSTITGGNVLCTSYFNKASGTINIITESLFTIGTNVDGTKDYISICATPCGGNEKYFGSANWLEFL